MKNKCDQKHLTLSQRVEIEKGLNENIVLITYWIKRYRCFHARKKHYCLLNKTTYAAKYADDEYSELLSSAREGINQTVESIGELDC